MVGVAWERDVNLVSDGEKDAVSVIEGVTDEVRDAEILDDMSSDPLADTVSDLEVTKLPLEVVESERSGLTVFDDDGDRVSWEVDNVAAEGVADTVLSLLGVHVLVMVLVRVVSADQVSVAVAGVVWWRLFD